LRVHQEAFLPTETHEMDTTIAALSAVINQQYCLIGAPFAQVPANDPQRLLEGYFPLEGRRSPARSTRKLTKPWWSSITRTALGWKKP
jgi:hypothetical protein